MSVTAITSSTNDLVIDWDLVTTDLYGNALTVDHYNVYRGTSPDFVADTAGGTNRIGQPTTNTYTDLGVYAAAGDYYYVVTAVSAGGDESLVSSAVAYKVRLDLVYDAGTSNRHWLSLPVNTSWASASDIGSSAPNISKVIRWDAATRSEQVWDVMAASGTDFPVTAGEAYAIEITADTTINLLGVDMYNNLALSYNASDFNHHWVSVPQPNQYDTASALASGETSVTKIATFDNTTNDYLSWFNLNGQWVGDDFALSPGMGVVVNVNSAAQWYIRSGKPSMIATVMPISGYESITVDLSGAVFNNKNNIASYEWDFEGDGVFDYSSPTTPDIQHTYTANGTYNPTLLVTDSQGHRAYAYVPVTVDSLSVDFSVDGFTPLGGLESVDISFTLPTDGLVTIMIYDEAGTLVRTLIADSAQLAGLRSFNWDGLNDLGQLVSDGTYYAVIQFTVAGHTSIYDTRLTSGGVDITNSITNIVISNTLSPLTGQFVEISYSLPENALVTILIKDLSGTVIRTLLNGVPRASGTHTELWDGTNDSGQFVQSGTAFNVDIASTSLSSNSLIASGIAPEMTGISATSIRFSPAVNPYGLNTNGSVVVSFDLNKTADVYTSVYNASGVLIYSDSQNLSAGNQSLSWGGRNNSNVMMSAGNYTMRLQAVDADGVMSNTFNQLTEIFY